MQIKRDNQTSYHALVKLHLKSANSEKLKCIEFREYFPVNFRPFIF